MKPQSRILAATAVAGLLLLQGCSDSSPVLPENHPAQERLSLLQEGEPRDREQAARALGPLAKSDRHPAIIAALLTASHDHQTRVQVAAVRSLGQLQDPTALDRLMQLAQPSYADGVRQAACEALGAIGDPSAVPVLEEALGADQLTVRLAATMALAGCGEEGRASLLSTFATAPHEAKPGVIKAIAKAGNAEDVDLFQEALRSSFPAVATAAAQAIASFPLETAIPALVAAVESGAVPGNQAVPLIISIDSSEARSAVSRLLANSGASGAAMQHLKLQHAKALPELHAYFEDESVSASGRIRALDLILEITEQSERGAGFSDIKRIPNPQYARNKYDLLTIDLHQHPELVATLNDRLNDKDQAVRQAVATLLVWQGFPQGAPILVEAANADVSASNTSVWRAIARFVSEARKRGVDVGDALDPLAQTSVEILALPHDPALVKSANDKRSPRKGSAEATLAALTDLQVAVIPVAAHLKVSGARNPVLAFALQPEWPKNPKGYHRLGSASITALPAWRDQAMEEAVWEAYQATPNRNLMRALSRLQVKKALPIFIEKSKNFSDRVTAVEAVRSLGDMDDPRATEAICVALRRDPPRRMMDKRQLNEIAQVGIPALVKLGHPEAVDTLVFLVRQPESPHFPLGYGTATRGWASRALANFPHPSGQQALLELLQDSSLDIAIKDSELAPAIIQSGSEYIIKSLVDLMHKSPPPEDLKGFDAGFYAADLLGTIGTAALPALSAALKNGNLDALVAQRCARALSHIPDDAVIPLLTELLKSDSPDVAMQAAVSLGQNKRAGALKALRSVSSDNKDVRDAIAWAIAQHK